MNDEEAKLLMRLDYVLKRGFREFSILYELKPDMIAMVKIELPSYLSSVFEENMAIFLYRFISQLDS